MDIATIEMLEEAVTASMSEAIKRQMDVREVAKLDQLAKRLLLAEAAYYTNSNLQTQKEH